MQGLSANLSMLFTHLSFLERFDAAARAGFSAVEFWFPYAHDAQDVRHALRSAGQRCVVINTPAGDTAAGDWGLAAVPGKQHQFEQSLELAAHYAEVMEPAHVHVMAGIVRADDAAAEALYLAHLRLACQRLGPQRGVLVEALNGIDRPGYFVNTIAQAAAWVQRVGLPNIGVMADLYHAQMQHGNLIANLRAHAACIKHVQVADVPGRHEPGTGEVHWPRVMQALRETGYAGWVGLECKPSGGDLTREQMQRVLMPAG